MGSEQGIEYRMGNNCISCVWSIPIGGVSIACWHTRKRVQPLNSGCAKFEKFVSSSDTSRRIGGMMGKDALIEDIRKSGGYEG